jgi:plasmid replication initiation protein
VAYAELGIEPSHYADVDIAARNMQSIVYEKEVDGMMRYKVAFPIVDVPALKEDGTPSGERRQNIYLHMTQSTAKDLFKLIPYHKYLKDAIFLFKSNYAGRIYLLINANQDLGTWRIAYDALRKILLTSWDEKRGATIDKYPDFNDFKKRVLEPARKEIEAAADKIDCTFDYEMEYPEGKKRGTPEAILFHIHLTDLGKSIKSSRTENKEDLEVRNALTAAGLTMTDAARLMKQCPSDKLVTLKEKAEWLRT